MTTQFAPIWDDATVAFTTIKANATDAASAAATTLLDLQVNNVSKFVVDKFGELIITPTARTSGSGSLIDLIAPADTTRAASTEATDINFNLARTVQFAAGNITDQRAVRIQAPTYSFESASTITNAATLSISGSPVAGTNATLTNSWAIDIQSGSSRFNAVTIGENSVVRVGNGIANRGRIQIQDLGQYSTDRVFEVFLGGIYAGQDIAAFSVLGNGNASSVGVISANSFLSGTYTFEGGWGSIQRAATTPTGNGNVFSNVYGLLISCGAGHGVSIASGTNAMNLAVYNTFTDASNYERLAFQFGTFSSVRHAQIAAESAGTGTANINLVLTPRGTGAFILGPPPDGTAVGGNTRGQYAIDLQLYRSAATQVASNYGVAIGSQITVSGDTGSIGIGRNVNVADSLGGATGIGRNVTITGYRGIGIGAGVTAAADSVCIGTGAYDTYGSGAVCIGGGIRSLFSGNVRWDQQKRIVIPESQSSNGAYSTTTSGQGAVFSGYAIRTVSDTPYTLINHPNSPVVELSTANLGSRYRHRAAFIYAEFTLFAVTSGSQISKWSRRVLIKDLANLYAGTTSTLSILQVETIGTDIEEISNISFAIGVNDAGKKMTITVTGQPAYSVTGDASTNTLTAIGNNFENDDIVVFNALTGGDGLLTNTTGQYYQGIYRVMNKSGDTFQLSLGNNVTPAVIDFTSDITSGTISRPILWTTSEIKFTLMSGGY